MFIVFSTNETTLVVVTPARSGTVGNVTIQLERYATVIVDTGRTFEYRHDPWLLGIQPRNHLTV